MGFSPSCPKNNWVQMNQFFLSASSFNSFQDSTIIIRKKDNILIENLKFMFLFFLSQPNSKNQRNFFSKPKIVGALKFSIKVPFNFL